MAAENLNLPEEIWVSIFTLIPNHHHEALSLVCKQFLSLTNHLKGELQLLPSYPTPGTIPTLLRRFTNLRAIDASGFAGDLDRLLYLISRSGLPIQEISFAGQGRLPVQSLFRFGAELKDLRVLRCSNVGILRSDELVKIAEAVPWIRDLDISYPVNGCDSMEEFGVFRVGRANLSDAGIESMSLMLPELTKINLSGNPFISDRAVVALATNCGMLREIVAVDCCFVTQIGIAEAMRKSPNLASVSVSWAEWSCTESSIIRASIWGGRSLSALHFSYSSISDEFLSSMVEAKLSLKHFTLSNCFGFSVAGISSLISAHQNLTCLNMERAECLTDEAMAGLVEFLPSLTSVNLNRSKVGHSTLFAIIRNCHFIEQVSMERTSLGKGMSLDAVLSVNRSMRSLKVAWNILDDECAVKMTSACPKLEVLDLSQCRMITAAGITEVLNLCREIRHLGMNHLTIGSPMKWDKCKVEVLEIKGLLGMNDDQLDMISKACPNLLCVDLSSCLDLSTAAVERLAKKCSKLRELRLDWYDDMSFGNLASIVFHRRSLRKVVFSGKRSCDPFLSGKLKDVLLQHGCQVVLI